MLKTARAELAVAVVPLLWHEEMGDVLVGVRRARKISAARFDDALALLRTLPLETHLNAFTVDVLVERALRYHLQAYDAVYFDLAKALGLPIAALDGGLRTAARNHGVELFDPE